MFPFSTVAAGTESREVNRFPLPNNTTTATAAVTEEKAELTCLQGEPPDSTDIIHYQKAVRKTDRLRTLADPLGIDKLKDTHLIIIFLVNLEMDKTP